MKRWIVYSLDVWGNEEDGFEVNDRCRVGTIETSDEPSNAEVWKAMLDSHIAAGDLFDAEFDWADESWLCIDDSNTGRPVFQLEAES